MQPLSQTFTFTNQISMEYTFQTPGTAQGAVLRHGLTTTSSDQEHNHDNYNENCQSNPNQA